MATPQKTARRIYWSVVGLQRIELPRRSALNATLSPTSETWRKKHGEPRGRDCHIWKRFAMRLEKH
jgi:hypothetical protein